MKFEFREIPAALKAQAEEYRAKMIEAAAEGDDALTDKYLDGVALTRRRDQARPQGARAQERDRAVHVRHRVQEQGRAGAARCRHRIHAVAHRACRPPRDCREKGETITRTARDEATVLGAGLQDPQRSVRRQSHVLPRLLRHAEFRRHGVRAVQVEEGAHRAPAADARQRAQRDQGSARRRHRRGRGPQGRLHRRHAFAISRRSSRSRR